MYTVIFKKSHGEEAEIVGSFAQQHSKQISIFSCKHEAIKNSLYGYIRNYRYSKGNPMARRNSLKPSFTVHVNFVYLFSQFSICR